MPVHSLPSPSPVNSAKAAETVALFGLPISNVTMAEAVTRIERAILGGGHHQIATANLDFARNALRDAALQRVICDCSMVLPDGAPMLWASRLFGKPLKERVTGVDLIPELARLSSRKGYRIFFLGSNETTSKVAQDVLVERFPGVKIVDRYAPPVASLEAMDHDAILKRVRSAAPHILLVAFGNPKQELWIHRFREELGVPVLIGIGGSLEMISGTVRRAPAFYRKLQLEWFYRMAQEPTRLLPRYVRDAVALVRHLPLGVAVHQMQPSRQAGAPLHVNSQEATREVVLPARLTGDVCQWLTLELQAAMSNDQNLLVNMRDVQRVDADGLGCLMEARRLLHARGLTLWLSELSPAVQRVMQYTAVRGLFLIAETTREAARLSTLGVPDGGIRFLQRPEHAVQASSSQSVNVA